MFVLGIAFFSAYAFLYAYDELRFHRARVLSRAEWRWRLLNTLLIAGAVGYALFVEYGKKTTTGFAAILGLSMLAFPLVERDRDAHVGGNERLVHGVLSMMHPLMLVYLGATWRFIDGAGFFLNMVLPFSTKHLRPLCWGYFGVMASIFLVQLVYWPLAFRRARRGVPPPLPLPADPLAGDASGLLPLSENEGRAAVAVAAPAGAATAGVATVAADESLLPVLEEAEKKAS